MTASGWPDVLPGQLAPRLLLCYQQSIEAPFTPTVRFPGVCLALVDAGAIRYRSANGATGRAVAGDVVCHHPGINGYDVEPGHTYVRYAVYFQAGPGVLAHGVPCLPGVGPLPDCIAVGSERERAIRIYEAMLQAMLEMRPTWALETAARILELLRLLFDRVAPGETNPRQSWDRWARLLARLEQYPGRDSVRQLAADFGLGPEQFIREFSRQTGTTPKQYILARRLWRARRLLQEGRMVKEAAYQAGFGSLPHFSRVYRKRFGYPPSQTPARDDTLLPPETRGLPYQRQFWAPGVSYDHFAL